MGDREMNKAQRAQITEITQRLEEINADTWYTLKDGEFVEVAE
jgi:hypothetical protein